MALLVGRLANKLRDVQCSEQLKQTFSVSIVGIIKMDVEGSHDNEITMFCNKLRQIPRKT